MHGKTLHFDTNSNPELPVAVLKALASVPRWRILQHLAAGRRTVNELADALELPASTAAAHIKILEEAGLVHTELQAASHGLQKLCNRTYDNLFLALPTSPADLSNVAEVAMPIGGYTAFEVKPTCGLATESALIGFLDDPLSFYEPDHVHASLLWFRSGYVEYTFPNRLPQSAAVVSLQVSMEICSEAPLHNHAWPSDITLWINDCEVGTWTCPADFGGQRGVLTPAWWDNRDSQYGLLKRWLINSEASFVDGRGCGALTIDKLHLSSRRVISVRLGVKPDALHVGGVNLFGRAFGNYAQDLTLRLEYQPGRRKKAAF
ncbi:MAG: ArsR family transcriptional regulator [Chloroflexi bacterium]|nr:MAG: ArsR family transcriptional regulator [Chloroflexota bacterium]